MQPFCRRMRCSGNKEYVIIVPKSEITGQSLK
jgi:hypothetical protein